MSFIPYTCIISLYKFSLNILIRENSECLLLLFKEILIKTFSIFMLCLLCSRRYSLRLKVTNTWHFVQMNSPGFFSFLAWDAAAAVILDWVAAVILDWDAAVMLDWDAAVMLDWDATVMLDWDAAVMLDWDAAVMLSWETWDAAVMLDWDAVVKEFTSSGSLVDTLVSLLCEKTWRNLANQNIQPEIIKKVIIHALKKTKNYSYMP